MKTFAKEYQYYCQKNGKPDKLELILCDLNGILRGKWLPEDSIDKFEKNAIRLPISTYAPNIMGQEVLTTGLGIIAGDPDGVLHPVPDTLKPVPWRQKHIAQIQVEMTDRLGEPLGLSSREILKSVLKRFEQRGLCPVIATELEFYIVQKRKNAYDAPIPANHSPDAQNYDLDVLSQQEAILDDILDAAKLQGLATDTLVAEYGAGQFEINFHHTGNVLQAAETAIMFKRLVRGVVNNHGMEATFMAKPYANMPGNGMHVHVSMVDKKGRNVFDSKTAALSQTLEHSVAGLLETMRDLQAVFAPHFNSYRRFQAGSFAPSRPDWGYDNRATGIRIIETKGPDARFEHRICGADVNPYLAISGILGGILYGIDKMPVLPPAFEKSDSPRVEKLCHDWSISVERFAKSGIAAEIFGTSYRDLYVKVRRDEISQLTSIISPMEYQYYLGR